MRTLAGIVSSLLSGFGLLSGTAAAQSQPATDAAARTFLDRVEKAIRGKATVAAPATWSAKGTFRLVLSGQASDKKIEGPFETLLSGDKAWSRVDYGSLGVAERGTDGKTAWEIHPAFGNRVYQGAEADGLVRGLKLESLAPWRDLYASAALAAQPAEIDGRACAVLTMTPRAGGEDTWYVDQETALPRRIDMTNGKEKFQIDFTDYKPVDGIQYPRQRKVTAGKTWGLATYETITHGAPIPPERFAVPERIARLLAQSPDGAVAGEGYQIQERAAQATATIRIKVKPAEISRQLAIALPEVMVYLNEIGAKTDGPPFSRYHGYQDGELDMEAGIPVKAAIAGRGRIKASELPAGKVVSGWHLGPYHKLQESYGKLEAWMKEHKHASRGGAWEIYWTDPGLEPDQRKWRTQILWPIE